MNTEHADEIIKAKRLAVVYNMSLNLFWSALSLVPISVFCYSHLTINLFWLFIGISIIPAFFPDSLIYKMQVANRISPYKKLGVGFVQQLTQNGKIVNGVIRKKYPNYKVIRKEQKSIKALLKQTFVFEKFHLMLFVFFCLAGFSAFSKGFYMWTVALFLLNLVYNVYPILLQQFIRIKLALYSSKNNNTIPVASKGLSKYMLN